MSVESDKQSLWPVRSIELVRAGGCFNPDVHKVHGRRA